MIKVDDSQMDIERLPEGGKTPSTSLTREANDDELMVRQEVQNEDGQQKKAVLCENEEHAESTLPKIETKMEKEEDTLHVALEKTNLGREAEKSSLEQQSLTEDSQGILDEQTDNKTVDAATTDETSSSITLAREANDDELMVRYEVQNEDEQLKKDELCENEEHAENTLEKIETKMEKGKDTLHVASEDNKASDLCQPEETSSLEQQSLTADPQGILDKQTDNKTVDAAPKEETLEVLVRNVMLSNFNNN